MDYTGCVMIAPAKNETPPETIDSDLQCGTCEYNLRTLPRDGACPECGRPLRESIMPRDLRFPSMGAIRRTRIGIACLILGLAVPAGIKIPLTLVTLASPLFWDQRSDHQSPISKLFRATSHAWYLGPELATVISAVGIILITVPLTRRSRRFSPRLGILTALFACVSAPCAAYSLAAKLPFSLGASSGAEWNVLVVLWLLFPLVGFAAVLLCWIFLTKRLDAHNSGALRITMRIALVVPVLLLTGAFAQMLVYMFDEYTWNPAARWVAYPQWWTVAEPITQRWLKVGASVCSIVMILALWAYVRRLNSALRGDAMGSPPRRETP